MPLIREDIRCSVMYTFGDNDEFSLRGSLSFFDGSALVDAETDTLIYPGENGILYLIRLNTRYDLNSGTLSIDPGRTVKWRYYGTRSSTESFWLGMEDSAAIYKGYIFMIQPLSLSGRLMQKPVRSCGIQIMNVLLMTVFPVEFSLRLPVERTALPIIYM